MDGSIPCVDFVLLVLLSKAPQAARARGLAPNLGFCRQRTFLVSYGLSIARHRVMEIATIPTPKLSSDKLPVEGDFGQKRDHTSMDT